MSVNFLNFEKNPYGLVILTFFLKVVILHIKLKGTMQAHTQNVKTFFFLSSHVAYQIKGNGAKTTMQAHILSLHTIVAPGVGSKGQNIFSESSHAAYQIKENGA